MQENRYIFLDGIRGVAAILVVIRHTSMFWDFSFFRSYLAVDLFFLLSGFVIAHAYDYKLKNRTLSFFQFARRRLIRLYPVFFLSVLMCVPVLYFEIGTPALLAQHVQPNFQGILLVISTAVFFPVGVLGNGLLFPLNGVYWSLFYELIANFVYALARPLLGSKMLFLIILIGVLGLAFEVNRPSGFDVGFYRDKHSMLAGFLRAISGIFIGLFLYRNQKNLGRYFDFPFAPWFAVAIISVILMSPSFSGLNKFIDFFAILVIFPMAIIAAAQGKSSRFNFVLLALGSASYPIYVFHAPISSLLLNSYRDFITEWAPLSGVLFVAVLVVLSCWLEKVYDVPVRGWLNKLNKNLTLKIKYK